MIYASDSLGLIHRILRSLLRVASFSLGRSVFDSVKLSSMAEIHLSCIAGWFLVQRIFQSWLTFILSQTASQCLNQPIIWS